MNKKSKLKSGAIVSLIITVVSTVLTLVGIALFTVFAVKDTGVTFGDYLSKVELTLVKDAYTYLFASDKTTNMIYGYTMYGESIPMIFSIGVLVVTVLALVAIVVGIILACKRKKAKYIGYSVLILVVTLIADMIITYGGYPAVGYATSVIEKIKGTDIPVTCVIFGAVTIVFGIVAFVTCIITYFKGLAYAKTPVVEGGEIIGDATIADQPVVAEEAITNEITEDVTTEEIVETTEDIIPDVEPEPEEIIEEETTVVEEEPVVDDKTVNVNVNAQQAPAIDTAALATMLREVVRDIVRDEIARNNVNKPEPVAPAASTSTITGATFGGPLVVQYFNGGINGVTPTPAPAPAAAPAPAPAPAVAPVVAEPAPAPVVAEPVAEPVVETPAPVEEVKEVKVYERIPFADRLFAAEKDLQDNYNELKNDILSWGVKSRVSTSGDTFRLHKKMYVKVTIAGKSLKLYFALDPNDYADSKIPVQDASNKSAYVDIPLVFKVKSALSVRRAKELIQATMEKDGLSQGEVMKVNWIKELKAEMKASKKPAKAEKGEAEDED